MAETSVMLPNGNHNKQITPFLCPRIPHVAINKHIHAMKKKKQQQSGNLGITTLQ